jgi:1,4-alpha-glucan branching enzyme
MAASMVAVVGAAWTLARIDTDRRADVAVSAAVDSVHLVRFVLVDSSATRVSLVGSFNQWERGQTVFQRTGVEGVWVVEVPLTVGRHEYAFVVSSGAAERWIADPFAPRRRDDFGTESSVIWIRPRSS